MSALMISTIKLHNSRKIRPGEEESFVYNDQREVTVKIGNTGEKNIYVKEGLP